MIRLVRTDAGLVVRRSLPVARARRAAAAAWRAWRSPLVQVDADEGARLVADAACLPQARAEHLAFELLDERADAADRGAAASRLNLADLPVTAEGQPHQAGVAALVELALWGQRLDDATGQVGVVRDA